MFMVETHIKEHWYLSYMYVSHILFPFFIFQVLTSYRCEHWVWPHGKVMYKLDSPQCSAFSEHTCSLERTPEIIMFLHNGE